MSENTEDISISNKDYKTAKNAFSYILNETSENSYYYEYSSLRSLDLDFEILINQKIKNIDQLKELGNNYKMKLEKFGIKQVVINIHYLGDQIVDYINNSKFNLSINIVKEKDKILDTGGGVLNAIKYFSNEPFLIINPDVVKSYLRLHPYGKK